MAPSSLFLTIILVIISQVSADEQLMKKECHNADNPSLCLQCLTSDPRSPLADPVGLARIILECLRSHIHVLVKTLSSLAAHHREKAVSMALKQCDSAYTAANRRLDDADGELVAGGYDRVAHDVIITTSYVLSCRGNLESVNSTVMVSPIFLYHTRVYLALTEAVLRIVDRF